jgi:hypothetical protein
MLRRALALAAILVAPSVVGCSWLVSLDGLSSGDVDASLADSGADGGTSDVEGSSSDGTAGAYLVVDDCVKDTMDAVDLTASGTLDWSHFSVDQGNPDVKNVPVHVLGALVQSTKGNKIYTDDPRVFSWSDGTTTPIVTGTSSGIFDNLGPMVVAASADPTHRVLTVYLGTYSANAELTISLSPGPASITRSFPGEYDDGGQVKCAIHYSAPAAATLRVTWSLTEPIVGDSDDVTPNIAFPAATVASE